MSGVIVLAQGRTGSSAVAGVLHHLGVYMGQTLPWTPDNAKGSYEDVRFVELHNEMIGGNWKRPKFAGIPLHLWDRYKALVDEMLERPLWGLKDLRLCFTFPELMRLMPDGDVKVVFVSREFDNIVHSIAKMADVKSWDEAADIAIGYFYALQHSIQVIPPRWDRMSVEYDRLVDSPVAQVKRLAKFLGLEATLAAMEFVDPKLRHHE